MIFEWPIDAVSSLYAQGHTNLVFKLMGSGPEWEEIKSYASGKPGKFEFLGDLFLMIKCAKFLGFRCRP
jgi:hypothetical protein